MANDNSTSDRNLKWATLIVSALSLIFTIVIAASNYQIDSKIKQLTAQKTEAEIQQIKESLQRDFKVKIFELCLNALKEKNPKQQNLALMAVQKLVKENDDFKQGLVNILTDSENPEVRNAAEAAKIVLQKDEATLKETPQAKPFHVDVFSFESLPSSKVLALKIYNALRFSALYEVSMKSIPENRQAIPAYNNIKHSLIRYDENEQAEAVKLKEVVNQILPEGAEPFNIEQTKAGKPTEHYISLFVVK